jgi:ABC-2 type transport system ATP-binding protein
MNKIIEVEHLVKRYAKATVNAVDDISFDIAEGEFFSFLGPNGAGKTTAISVLTTTLSKTSGKVIVAGFDVETQAAQVRQNTGIIFQNPSLDKNLTAEENIRFHAILYGLFPFRPLYAWMPRAYKDKVEELTAIIGLEGAMSQPVRTFSGGMKRKLEIVRSLIHNPKVLFLDEPTTGLDPASRKELWQYIQKIRKEEGTTIFLTTHYLDEAEDADRVVVINKGKIAADGSPEQLKSQLTEKKLIITAADSVALNSELAKLNLQFSKQANEFILAVNNTGSDVQKVMQQIKTPLSDIKVFSPSLNDAYIQLIATENES